MAKQQATYHQAHGNVVLDVLTTNPDGTLDLGRNGELMIRSAPPGSKHGQAALVEDRPTDDAAKAKTKK